MISTFEGHTPVIGDGSYVHPNADIIGNVSIGSGCWIGPGDLAASMGIDLSTPEGARAHDAAILSVLEACHKTGKIPGICAVGSAQRWIDEGFLFVTAASDYGYILSSAPETVRELGVQP